MAFCAGKNDGTYADPKDCSGFYKCIDGQTEKKYCWPGQLYNALISQCDVAENVNCIGHDIHQPSDYFKENFNAVRTENNNNIKVMQNPIGTVQKIYKLNTSKNVEELKPKPLNFRPDLDVHKEINYTLPFSLHNNTKGNLYHRLILTDLPTSDYKWSLSGESTLTKKTRPNLIFTGKAENEILPKEDLTNIQTNESGLNSSYSNGYKDNSYSFMIQYQSQGRNSNTNTSKEKDYLNQKEDDIKNETEVSKDIKHKKNNFTSDGLLYKTYKTSSGSSRKIRLPQNQFFVRKKLHFTSPYAKETTDPKSLNGVSFNYTKHRLNLKLSKTPQDGPESKSEYAKPFDPNAFPESLYNADVDSTNRLTRQSKVSFSGEDLKQRLLSINQLNKFPGSAPIFESSKRLFQVVDAEGNSPRQQALNSIQPALIMSDKTDPSENKNSALIHQKRFTKQHTLEFNNNEVKLRNSLIIPWQMKQYHQKGNERSNGFNLTAFRPQIEPYYHSYKFFTRPTVDQTGITIDGIQKHFGGSLNFRSFQEGLRSNNKTDETQIITNEADVEGTLQEGRKKTEDNKYSQWSAQHDSLRPTKSIKIEEGTNMFSYSNSDNHKSFAEVSKMKSNDTHSSYNFKRNKNQTKIMKAKIKQQHIPGSQSPERSNSSRINFLTAVNGSSILTAGNWSRASPVTKATFPKPLPTPSQLSIARPLVKPSQITQQQQKENEEVNKKLKTVKLPSLSNMAKWNYTNRDIDDLPMDDNMAVYMSQEAPKTNRSESLFTKNRRNGNAVVNWQYSANVMEKSFQNPNKALKNIKWLATSTMNKKVSLCMCVERVSPCFLLLLTDE